MFDVFQRSFFHSNLHDLSFRTSALHSFRFSGLRLKKINQFNELNETTNLTI